MTTTTAPDAAEVYALGTNPAESARLRRQSDELRPQSTELLARIGLVPGQSASDRGCVHYRSVCDDNDPCTADLYDVRGGQVVGCQHVALNCGR